LARVEPLRNPSVFAALVTALANGRTQPLFAVLCRFSGLPGPRCNDGLALAFGRALLDAGAPADKILTELAATNAQRAPAGTVMEYLPIVAAFGYAARVGAGVDRAGAMASLRELAEDSRHAVRDGVVRAVGEAARAEPDAIAEALGAWTDGYLSASVALVALTQRTWLDRLSSPSAVLARFDEAFVLVEGAPRADQRSQGFRTLVRTLGEAPASLLSRFGGATIEWLEARAATQNVELRRALESLVQNARARGHAKGELEGVARELEASAKPRRDPKTYVGPTRKRGARRR
jgi:hypothetical protein